MEGYIIYSSVPYGAGLHLHQALGVLDFALATLGHSLPQRTRVFGIHTHAPFMILEFRNAKPAHVPHTNIKKKIKNANSDEEDN